MMMNNRVTYLLNRYQAGQVSSEEMEELTELLIDSAMSDKLDTFATGFDLVEFEEKISPLAWERIREYIAEEQETVATPARVYSLKKWISIAAAAMVLLAAGVYLFNSRSIMKQGGVATTTPIEIAPGTQKATLTLAGGTVIALDKMQQGELAREGGATIRSDKGELTYADNQDIQTGKITVWKNTLTTPNGGEFKLVLPDGSKVWLNAASSLHFPSQFNGITREVELTGEAYFEIAQRAKMPFVVKTPTTKIEVLGTHFNVNAYPGDARTRTTLLEGSVRVASATHLSSSSVILQPGQQAATTSGGVTTARQVDTEAAVAWQQGLFFFENVTVPEIMQQIGRWYNVDIHYEGVQSKPSSATYVIRFPRNLALSKALEILDKLNIHTRITNGREVTVLL